ncbi:MAG: hypothetical protein EZS28_045206, partial [Streblomastix strix]
YCIGSVRMSTPSINLLWKLIEDKQKTIISVNDETKMTIIMILIMIYTNLRLKELHRANIDLIKLDEGIITIETIVKKGETGTVKLTIRSSEKEANSVIYWMNNWRCEQKSYKQSEIWRNITADKHYTYESCSKLIRKQMCEAGIPKGQRVTSIRAAAITKAINLGASAEQVNRWSRHADTANTVLKFYDRNNNEDIRRLIQI